MMGDTESCTPVSRALGSDSLRGEWIVGMKECKTVSPLVIGYIPRFLHSLIPDAPRGRDGING